MSKSYSHRHPLASLVALQETFKLDDADYETQLYRDRQIALDSNAINEGSQLSAWLNSQSTSKTNTASEKTVFSWKLSQLFVFVLGTLLGLGISTITLYYDGTKPINIIQAWLILAGLPVFFLGLWLATILHFPGIRFLSEAIQHSFFQPLNYWLAKKVNGFSTSHLNSKLAFSLSSVLMQWFALGIAIGSFMGTTYILSTSDLAFVWSTSLDIEERQFHQITSVLAYPFQYWIDNSAPTEQLIQSSHYFRLDGVRSIAHFGAEQTSTLNSPLAHTLTQWWPFLLASIGYYAVIPRILSLILASVLSRRALSTAISSLPEYHHLLARMNAPLLSTKANTLSSGQSQASSTVASELSTSKTQFDLTAPVVNWGDIHYSPSSLKIALLKRGFTQGKHYYCSGTFSTEEDRITIQQIHQDKVDGVIVLVKSWEPPLLEFKDWLGFLRKEIKGPIVVILLDPDNIRPSINDLQLWRQDLQNISDDKLYIEALAL